MCETAANGAARAHRAVGDATRHAGEKAAGRIGHAAVFDGRVRHRGADGDAIAVLGHGG